MRPVEQTAHRSRAVMTISAGSISGTDGQMDIILIARPRLHSMKRGKNHSSLLSTKLPKRLSCLKERRELLQ